MHKRAEPLNVLVIEDDPLMSRSLLHVLHRAEHQVVLAASAEEGLALLPSWTFQIAFVDQNLPGMEGLVLGEYLRRNNPDMSIVLMTGMGDPRIERRSRDLALSFMPKPFGVQEVLQIVEQYLAGAAERDAQRKLYQDRQFEPPIESFVDELADCYALPKVPSRVEEGLAQTVKRCLNNLKSPVRYTERDRVLALSGLLTARVLGVSLPHTKTGLTLFQEYDRLMLEHGRRTEFAPSAPGSLRPGAMAE
jgi:CheY-like chemotaxis protein